MNKWIAIFGLLVISSTASAGTLTRCEQQILNAAETNIDLKVRAYNIRGFNATTGEEVLIDGNIDRSSLTQKSINADSLTATVSASDIGSLYEIEVKVGSRCDVQSVVIRDLGDK